MNIAGKHYRTIWPLAAEHAVQVIDQTLLPFAFSTRTITTAAEAADAISTMVVRGAPLIGVTAAYGLALAMQADPSDHGLETVATRLLETRPTAVNLRWALDIMKQTLRPVPQERRAEVAFRKATEMADADVAINEKIGVHGLALLQDIASRKPAGSVLNILTHCNAGWLATVDWGTATAPIYKAHGLGMNIHVWVDETRPRNQGASLTAFELAHEAVPHTVIADNTGGHLMQHGKVDLVIVGSDRTTRRGDVANKIGTYLKALAARDNGVPFYVALPTSTIDLALADGVADVPIEQRSEREVTHITGKAEDGTITAVRVVPEGSSVANYGFDVTPARLVSGLITERGVVPASEAGIAALFA